MTTTRRGFLRLLGAAAPALVLAKDFTLPVDEIAAWVPGVGAPAAAPLVSIADLTARVATILADSLAGRDIVLTDTRYRLFEGTRSWVDAARLTDHIYAAVPPLDQMGVNVDRYLEPAATALADQMRHDGVTVVAPLPVPVLVDDAAVVSRGGVSVRGVSYFDATTRLYHTTFDVLYGCRA